MALLINFGIIFSNIAKEKEKNYIVNVNNLFI
jgi:hypothetical protein